MLIDNLFTFAGKFSLSHVGFIKMYVHYFLNNLFTIAGKFSLSHAGFIEVYEQEDGEQYMYITTFNAGFTFQ